MDTVASRRRSLAGLALVLAAAFLTPVVVPGSPVLPAPDGAAEQVLSGIALALAASLGYAFPRPSLYALLLLAVIEGGVRKWVANDVTVFLVKDFLALGVYAAVLTRLRPDEWRRSPWVVVPLVGLLAVAAVSSLWSDAWTQTAIGLRAYAIYLPLLWVAPKLLDTTRRVNALLAVVLVLGLGEAAIAIAQVLTANAWLNETVAGMQPVLAASGGVLWLRPTGTMVHSSILGAFLVFPTLVALAFVTRGRDRLSVAAGALSLAVLTWGILYLGSRALFVTVAAAAAALFGYLIWQRRFLALAAVALAVAAGALLPPRLPLIGGEGADELRTETYRYVDDGTVKTVRITVGRPRAGAASGGVIDIVAGEPQDTQANGPFERLTDQAELLADQGFVGHGTGSLTLGSQYLHPVQSQATESTYIKVAYELGLPALALFLVFLVALWVSAIWSSFVAPESRRPAAAVALGAATFVPFLSALTFAFDYPVVAIPFAIFTGCALAWAQRHGAPQPSPTAPAALREAASAPPTPTRA